jgi:uncharacterized protein Veg
MYNTERFRFILVSYKKNRLNASIKIDSNIGNYVSLKGEKGKRWLNEQLNIIERYSRL